MGARLGARDKSVLAAPAAATGQAAVLGRYTYPRAVDMPPPLLHLRRRLGQQRGQRHILQQQLILGDHLRAGTASKQPQSVLTLCACCACSTPTRLLQWSCSSAVLGFKLGSLGFKLHNMPSHDVSVAHHRGRVNAHR